MKRLLALVVFTTILFVGAAQVPDLYGIQIKYVVVDYRQKAYTIFYSIPGGMIDERDPGIAGNSGIALIKWKEFKKNKDKYILERIINNDYEDYNINRKFVRLLMVYPINRFGLTWNGGVAVSESDYRHAMSTYKDYKTDPEGYKRSKNKDPESDPVNPEYQMKKLL